MYSFFILPFNVNREHKYFQIITFENIRSNYNFKMAIRLIDILMKIHLIFKHFENNYTLSLILYYYQLNTKYMEICNNTFSGFAEMKKIK